MYLTYKLVKLVFDYGELAKVRATRQWVAECNLSRGGYNTVYTIRG